jgi:hypothetical protein
MIREGYDPSLAVQQANLERAREHEEKSIEYAAVRAERARVAVPALAIVEESVRVLRAEDLFGKPLATQAARLAELNTVVVPDALERATTEALVTKDKIIEAVEPFESHAASHEELVHKDRPGIEIMDAASSPEALREETALAQIAADNMTAEAAKAVTKMTEYVDEVGGERATTEPGEVLEEAEEVVGGVTASDEMRENPKE